MAPAPLSVAPTPTPTPTPQQNPVEKDWTGTFPQQQSPVEKDWIGTFPQQQGIVPKVTPPQTGAIGLTGATKQAYDMLSPYEQKVYNSLSTQGIKAQTDYLEKSKAQKEYA